MKLLDLYIDGFGRFQNQEFTFLDGFNIIYGNNEAGKSTLHTFIRSMLFGLERARGRASKNDTWSHYQPWNSQAAYGGRMRTEQNGIIYRIERNFQKEHRSFTIVDETNGREIFPTKIFFDEFLCGLTETSYANTVSIGQLKSATDTSMVSELRNYIANMNTSGSMSLNIAKATANLRNHRKQFERQLHPGAIKAHTDLAAEICNMETEIANPKYKNELAAWQTMRTQIQQELAHRQQNRENLLQKTAAARQALTGAQFTDEESIKKYLADTEDIYQEYLICKDACGKKARPLWAMLFVFLTVLAAAGVAFCYAAGAFNPLAAAFHIKSIYLLCAFFIFGIIFLWGSIAVSHENRRLDKEMSTDGKLLEEVFTRHLGDSSISDEAMGAFRSRMEEFVHLSQMLAKSETVLKEQSEAIHTLHEKEESCSESISSQQKAQWELEKTLEHLAACKDRLEILEKQVEENNRILEEIQAIDLALDTITKLSATIRDSFGLYLNKTASEMIHGITGGIYNSMSVDENLDIFMNTPTRLVPVSQVSNGTMDQIYLALRLATAQLIQEGCGRMPLIFDDSFALYDDERLEKTLEWLAKAWTGQILMFTCHQREAKILAAKEIPYHLISL